MGLLSKLIELLPQKLTHKLNNWGRLNKFPDWSMTIGKRNARVHHLVLDDGRVAYFNARNKIKRIVSREEAERDWKQRKCK